jgi:uncharacterized protein (TIGR03663 family)
VATTSTKSRARNKKGAQKKASAGKTATTGAGKNTAPAARAGKVWREEGFTRSEIGERTWQVASIVILAAATALRLYDYALRPLHHDEGVNGFFLVRLFREGAYQYDPANYHGPTLYYFSLIPTYLFGLNTFSIRFVPAAFGVATVWLALLLRRYIGSVGALTAAALLAVSPGMVFFSRYYIHEILFVFFTLGLVVAALRYYETGNAVYVMLASLSTALLFATKETAFISIGVLLIATAMAWGYMRLVRDENSTGRESRWQARGSKTTSAEEEATTEKTFTERFGGWGSIAILLVAALALFVIVNVMFYSSFFTYKQGLNGALETFKIWSKTGMSEFHKKPFDAYLEWLQQEEGPIYLLGSVGAIWAVLAAKSRFAVFAALWTGGILMAYSLVPYKTPWLALSFIVPLAIVAGYAVELIYRGGAELFRRRPGEWSRALAITLVLAAVSVCAYQAYQINFVHYDDAAYPYVYAHTKRQFHAMLDEVQRVAKRAGTNEQTGITVMSQDYWPMPWYMREYKRVGYTGTVASPNEPIVIVSDRQEAQAQPLLGGRYQRVGSYELRPGATLILYVRNELAGR